MKELIAQGADLHFISSLSKTPFLDLLKGLFLEAPMEPPVSDPDDLGSMEHSVCNTLEARCSQLEVLPWLLNIWLECLQESGVDLEAYGRKETALHQQGLVPWTWLPWRSGPGRWLLTSLTYGPSPSDWKADMEYQPEDAAESLAKMPGGWIEDEQCEGGEDLCVEEGREIEEEDS